VYFSGSILDAHASALGNKGGKMNKNMAISAVRKFLSPHANIDALRIYYCYQIGSTFVALNGMENTILHAMSMCDQIRLENTLQDDAPAWRRIVERQKRFKSATLGNLITILSKHELEQADLHYLKWVKSKRDFFIHRFFHSGPWPGDLPEDAIPILCRRLLYLEHIFNRMGNRIWKIFSRAELLRYRDLGEDGAFIANIGTLDSEEAWMEELAVAAIRDRARAERAREHPAVHPALPVGKRSPHEAQRNAGKRTPSRRT
jgi:hypothetical protein